MLPVATNDLPRLPCTAREDDTVEWHGVFVAHGGHGTDETTTIVFEISPGKRLGWHTDQTEETQYIVAGTGELVLDEGKFPVGPGSVFVLPTNVGHDLVNTGTETPALRRVLRLRHVHPGLLTTRCRHEHPCLRHPEPRRRARRRCCRARGRAFAVDPRGSPSYPSAGASRNCGGNEFCRVGRQFLQKHDEAPTRDGSSRNAIAGTSMPCAAVVLRTNCAAARARLPSAKHHGALASERASQTARCGDPGRGPTSVPDGTHSAQR